MVFRKDTFIPYHMRGSIELITSFTPVLGNTKSSVGGQSYRQPQDETLGFDAAVAAIGMKANVCEADHPLLCEATRRQVQRSYWLPEVL